MIAKKIIVTGKVQGVFFRKNTRQKGIELKVAGWVKNTDNGSVEIFVQGEENVIYEFIEWCKQGPPKANVSGIDATDSLINGNCKHFTIQYK